MSSSSKKKKGSVSSLFEGCRRKIRGKNKICTRAKENQAGFVAESAEGSPVKYRRVLEFRVLCVLRGPPSTIERRVSLYSYGPKVTYISK